MWKCPNCETINKTNICVVCGHKYILENEVSKTLGQDRNEPNIVVENSKRNDIMFNKKNKQFKPIYAIVAIIVISLLAILFYMTLLHGEKANSVADDYDPYTYDYVSGDWSTYDLYTVVKQIGDDYKYGFIDAQDKIVVPLIYDLFGNDILNGKYILAQLDGKWGVIDRNNNKIIDFKYDEAFFLDGVLNVLENDKYKTIDLPD